MISFFDQLFIQNVQHGKIPVIGIIKRFQKRIPLLQDLGIVDQALQVVVIQLGKQGVNELSSFLAAANDQLDIIRGNDHAGIMANMFGELRV